jgi:hypothetical protein
MHESVGTGDLSVPLGGLLVRCDSSDDAAAIAKAAAILDHIDRAHHPPGEIQRLAKTLVRYGHARAARVLKRRSTDA